MMNREEIVSKVEEIFKDIFDDEDLVIENSTSADDIDEWDSLNHISLISTIETEFKIKFALGELQTLKDVGTMIDSISEKLV